MATPNPVEDFIRHTQSSLEENTFVRLILSGGTEAEGAPKRVLGRLIRLRGEPHLSLTLRHATNDVTKNLKLPEVAKWLGFQLKGNFRSALLGTTIREWQLNFPPDKEPWLISHKPHTKNVPSRNHDEAKQTWLDASARDWLFGLGVCDDRGQIIPSMADKHRQIHQYLEILSHLLKDCGWGSESLESRPEAVGEPAEAATTSELVIADMGCGKGYLTFGIWHLLCRRWRVPARIVGVETRPELVKNINYLARKLDAPGLEFIAGDIASAELPTVDALIALHACNTATDDAIRRGIGQKAKLIVVAPCCHKEVRAQLGRPAPLAPVLEHGIMAERMAEWVTDGLRALFLEWAGYRTKIIEFVSSEHTPKNLMLAAIREREPFTNEATRAKIIELKQFFGIDRHALDGLLQTSTTDGHELKPE
jgi:SAM-dependent methyltransferase